MINGAGSMRERHNGAKVNMCLDRGAIHQHYSQQSTASSTRRRPIDDVVDRFDRRYTESVDVIYQVLGGVDDH
ncbi:unnamed protein product [Cylicostephanus goldi]|uniref:Uncharacterized protein n=1 Tax=Cylicostephanus goldi TaxID=71465 RepID=A0A3P7Q002_CYLGO|nr:unnamed protein product [Cylicostephanus goldi]